MTPIIRYAVEGITDEPVAERIITDAGGVPHRMLTAGGKSVLDPKLRGLKAASLPAAPILVLRDLDHDAPCAGELAERLSGGSSPSFLLRIAVRQAESWLLADRQGFGRFFSISAQHLARDPDELDDAKRALVHACARSTKKRIRADMLPRSGSGRRVGPGYEATIAEFAARYWNVEAACMRSPSLDRACARLRELVTAMDALP